MRCQRRGRDTFGPFPDVMGDDHFVRDRIAPERRTVIDTIHSTVTASGNLTGLLRRKPRTVSGNQHLDAADATSRRRSRQRRRQWLGGGSAPTVAGDQRARLPAGQRPGPARWFPADGSPVLRRAGTATTVPADGQWVSYGIAVPPRYAFPVHSEPPSGQTLDFGP